MDSASETLAAWLRTPREVPTYLLIECSPSSQFFPSTSLRCLAWSKTCIQSE